MRLGDQSSFDPRAPELDDVVRVVVDRGAVHSECLFELVGPFGRDPARLGEPERMGTQDADVGHGGGPAGRRGKGDRVCQNASDLDYDEPT